MSPTRNTTASLAERSLLAKSESPARERGFYFSDAGNQFTRVHVWPPQNIPPNAQPCTRSVSGLFSAMVES